MARTPVLERPGSIRMLGAVLVALMLFLVWVTYAFFDKQFVSSKPVYITTERTGVNLPQNADVKLRGMIVGEVRSIEPHGEGVKMTLAMNPDLLDEVPRDVTAKILPKTLFGEKYVALEPTEDASAAKLQPGDTITQASVPIEVEQLLNDAYPLLNAVDPANLSYTLTAVSDALTGRGEELGQTLVTANDYLQEINPEVPQLVSDLTTLGTVADGYAAAMPDLGRLLENTTTTGNTLVAKRKQLAAFFDEGASLADTLTDFTKDNGEDLASIAKDGRPLVEMLADYSPTFPCFLGGMRELIPRLDSAFRDQRLHIDLRLNPPTTAYGEDEPLSGTKADFDNASKGPGAKNGHDIRADNAASPTCLDLDRIIAASEAGDQDTIDAIVGKPGESTDGKFDIPASVYKLVNIKNNHGKFGDAGEYERIAPTSDVQPTVGSFFSNGAASAMRVLIAAGVGGVDPEDVPDLAAVMVGPAVQGAGVSFE